MIDYKLIEEESSYSLEAAVNRAIREGWEPFGNLQVITIRGSVIDTKKFFQPMTRMIAENELFIVKEKQEN